MAKKPDIVFPTAGLVLVASYFAILAVNIVILYLANWIFSRQVVLGTFSISYGWAVLHSMGLLALLDTFAIPFIHYYEFRLGRILGPREWLIFYGVINFAGLWFISRFADALGLGLSSWWVALYLGFIFSFTQGIVMMSLDRLLKR